MQMQAGLDTGPMLVTERCDITTDDTGGSLHDKLADLGARALLECLSQLQAGTAQPVPQDHDQASYAGKLSKQEANLDWRQSAQRLHDQVRAFNPWPVATALLDDQTIRVWQTRVSNAHSQAQPGTIIGADRDGIHVATGEGVLSLLQLQLPGAKVLASDAVLNSKRALFAPGQQFQ